MKSSKQYTLIILRCKLFVMLLTIGCSSPRSKALNNIRFNNEGLTTLRLTTLEGLRLYDNLTTEVFN